MLGGKSSTKLAMSMVNKSLLGINNKLPLFAKNMNSSFLKIQYMNFASKPIF